MARHSLIVATAACALAVAASSALAQSTTYGEDPVPSATEAYERWAGYGTDPVPHNRMDNGGYIWAYGIDPVPGTPSTYRQPQDSLHRIVPNQTLQVLTSDTGGDTDCPPAGR